MNREVLDGEKLQGKGLHEVAKKRNSSNVVRLTLLPGNAIVYVIYI
jgi:hypothetical protein